MWQVWNQEVVLINTTSKGLCYFLIRFKSLWYDSNFLNNSSLCFCSLSWLLTIVEVCRMDL